MSSVSVTCYVEILSSWCFWAEPALDALKRRCHETVTFNWQIALMPPEAFPKSQTQCDAYYRRSGSVMRSAFMLNSSWFDPALNGNYNVPNYVAEAAKDLGFTDDRLRRHLSKAALIDGQKIGHLDTAVTIVSEEFNIDPTQLKTLALSQDVQNRVAKSTEIFHTHQIDQRPAFIIQSDIGDKAIFSGLVKPYPLIATINAMRSDSAGYASYHAHFGGIS